MRRHRLTCNPNLCEEGVRGRLEAHGLVLVLVCGTLHTSSNVCGVFEQVLDFLSLLIYHGFCVPRFLVLSGTLVLRTIGRSRTLRRALSLVKCSSSPSLPPPPLPSPSASSVCEGERLVPIKERLVCQKSANDYLVSSGALRDFLVAELTISESLFCTKFSW